MLHATSWYIGPLDIEGMLLWFPIHSNTSRYMVDGIPLLQDIAWDVRLIYNSNNQSEVHVNVATPIPKQNGRHLVGNVIELIS